MKLSRLTATLALAAVAGCASPSGVAESSVPYAPSDVVLRVRTAGGFVAPQAAMASLPEVSVYGDGRVVTTGPIPAVYPGPALPNVQLQRIAPAELPGLVHRALDAGVGSGADLGSTHVADAPTTTFTVRTVEGVVTTDAPALGVGGDDGLTGPQHAARQRLRDLLAALTDLRGTLGADAVSRPEPYRPALVAAFAGEWAPGTQPQLPDPPEIAWPGPALPGPPLPDRPNVHCLTTEAAPVLAAAAGANARTPWTSAGARWALQLRPLLPDESSCADLTR